MVRRGAPHARPFDSAQGERPDPAGWIPVEAGVTVKGGVARGLGGGGEEGGVA